MRSVLLSTSALGAFFLAACSESLPNVPAPKPCVPAYEAISQDPIVTTAGLWELRVQAALIGCRKDLDKITLDDKYAIREVLERRLREESVTFMTTVRDPARRETLFSEIFATLGPDKPVADILLHDFFPIEMRPRAE